MTTAFKFELTNGIANRRWLRRTFPFHHVVAQDVFTHTTYRDLETAFQEVLSRGLSDVHCDDKMSRNMKNYDAYSINFLPQDTGPLKLFTSREWHDLMGGVMGIRATGDVTGGLHHHRSGSFSGSIHNDLNSGWFLERPNADGINVADPRICDYKTGETFPTGQRSREVLRAATMIYFLCNPHWQPGDGGETGLYDGMSAAVDAPAVAIPPLNNSLIVFECSPFSYHSFVRNRRNPRNSIILWIHRTKEEVHTRWGEHSIVQWT